MKRTTSNAFGRLFLPGLAMLLMAVPAVHATGGAGQPLALSMNGAIADAGRHQYTSQGGLPLFASVMGQQLDLAKTSFSYKIKAEVAGLSVTGQASFSLKGQTAGGESVKVTGNMRLNELQPVPGEVFPLGCTSACQSEIVAFYIGAASVDISVGGVHQHAVVPVAFESAFLDPFGNPIVISSLDDGATFTVVTTYTSADIHWLDVQTVGALSGTFNGSPVSGQFTINSAAKDENLLAGTETETGTMTFSSMSPGSLDVSGKYSGTSTIPTAGAVDCSALVTGIPGTCLETGFASQGAFQLSNHEVKVSGTYQTSWLVPALGFTGSATATVTQAHK